MNTIRTAYILAPLLLKFTMFSFAQQELKLYYNQPADQWEETIPFGNGRLGMVPDGHVFNENIVLLHHSSVKKVHPN